MGRLRTAMRTLAYLNLPPDELLTRLDELYAREADEGDGIPVTERGRVFERFTRGDRAVDGGTGLGLAIARWVVQLHHGTIAVVDPVDGPRGCHIHVTLPVQPA